MFASVILKRVRDMASVAILFIIIHPEASEIKADYAQPAVFLNELNPRFMDDIKGSRRLDLRTETGSVILKAVKGAYRRKGETDEPDEKKVACFCRGPYFLYSHPGSGGDICTG